MKTTFNATHKWGWGLHPVTNQRFLRGKLLATYSFNERKKQNRCCALPSHVYSHLGVFVKSYNVI